MSKIGLTAPVELNVAADAGMMLVIRLTTAGTIARAGLTVDVMDSLKMATEEACNCLIGQQNAPERLNLRFSCADNRLEITVEACGAAECEAEMDETELEVIRCILESLSDEVLFDIHGGQIRSIGLYKALA